MNLLNYIYSMFRPLGQIYFSLEKQEGDTLASSYPTAHLVCCAIIRRNVNIPPSQKIRIQIIVRKSASNWKSEGSAR